MESTFGESGRVIFIDGTQDTIIECIDTHKFQRYEEFYHYVLCPIYCILDLLSSHVYCKETSKRITY